MVSDSEDRKRSSEEPIAIQSAKKVKRNEEMELTGSASKNSAKARYTATLAIRIKNYLQTNRTSKFVDIDSMAQTLYDDHEEYRSKKFKAFKMSVDRTFTNLKAELEKISSSKKSKPPAPKDRTPDETTTVKKSLSGRMIDLYKKPVASSSSDEKTTKIQDADNDEIIEEPVVKAPVELITMDSDDDDDDNQKTTEKQKCGSDENEKSDRMEPGKGEKSDSKKSDEVKPDSDKNDKVTANGDVKRSDKNTTTKIEKSDSEGKASDDVSGKKRTDPDNDGGSIKNRRSSNAAVKNCASEQDSLNMSGSKQNGDDVLNGNEESISVIETKTETCKNLENPPTSLQNGDRASIAMDVDSTPSKDNLHAADEAEEALTDFERIKRAAQAVKRGDKSNKSTNKTRPSKSLSKYLKKDLDSPAGKTKTDVEALDDSQVSEPSPNEVFNGSSSTSTPVLSSKPAAVSSTASKSTAAASNASAAVSNASAAAASRTTAGKPSIDDSEIRTPRNTKSKRSANTGEHGTTAKKRKNTVEIQSSSARFSDFGGNDSQLCDICKLLAHLKHPELYRELGVTPPRGFLLHGPPGCGKTLLAHAIVGELGLPFIKIAAPEIVSGVSGDSESKLRDLFQQAEDASPCVLFIDEIDSITPKRENAQREMERRIVAQLLTCLDDLGKGENQVVVIGATNRPDSLDPALRRAGRFDREIALGIPDRSARLKILAVLSRNLRLNEDVDLKDLAALTPGYVGADLSSLVREAAIAAVNRMFKQMQDNSLQDELHRLLDWLKDTPPLTGHQLDQLNIQQADFKEALKIVQPSAKREGFATVPGVTWADVGALADIREELQLSILAPVRFQEDFETLGLPASSGVLLAGPPGCGKTLVAKAIANEAGVNFISVKGPELLNMYVGESERAVRACFQRARNSSPCVIFFDEIDSLCPKRSGNSSDGGSSSRVVNQLLTEMDGVEARNGVFLMAATNRPDILDPAVLRPGRLDKILYVGFPGPRDRIEILTAITKDGTKPRLEASVDLSRIGEDPRCEGFSGADMSALVREASMAALKEALRRKDRPTISVGERHFERAFSCLKPSVGAKDRAKYLAMQQRYSRNNSGSDDGSSGSRSNVAATVHHRKDVVNIVDEGAAKETAAIFEEQQTEMEDDTVELGEAAVEEGGHEEVDGVVERDSGSKEELAPKKLLNEPMSETPSSPTVIARKVVASGLTHPAKTTANDAENSPPVDGHTDDQVIPLVLDNSPVIEDADQPSYDESADNSNKADKTNDDAAMDVDDDHGLVAEEEEREKVVTDRPSESSLEPSPIDVKEGNELSEESMSSELVEKDLDQPNKNHLNGCGDDIERADKSEADAEESCDDGFTEVKEDQAKDQEVLDDSSVQKSPIPLETCESDQNKSDEKDAVTVGQPDSVCHGNGQRQRVSTDSEGDEQYVLELRPTSLDDLEDDGQQGKARSEKKDSVAAAAVEGVVDSMKNNKPCSSLRFLPLMMIRVVDSSKVKSAAGKTGQVKNTRKNSKVTVTLEGIIDGSLSQRIVDLAELEPFMPEEGDKVKLLLHATREDVGEVLRMDDQDVCEVRFKDGIYSYQIDHLCKLVPDAPELL